MSVKKNTLQLYNIPFALEREYIGIKKYILQELLKLKDEYKKTHPGVSDSDAITKLVTDESFKSAVATLLNSEKDKSLKSKVESLEISDSDKAKVEIHAKTFRKEIETSLSNPEKCTKLMLEEQEKVIAQMTKEQETLKGFLSEELLKYIGKIKKNNPALSAAHLSPSIISELMLSPEFKAGVNSLFNAEQLISEDGTKSDAKSLKVIEDSIKKISSNPEMIALMEGFRIEFNTVLVSPERLLSLVKNRCKRSIINHAVPSLVSSGVDTISQKDIVFANLIDEVQIPEGVNLLDYNIAGEWVKHNMVAKLAKLGEDALKTEMYTGEAITDSLKQYSIAMKIIDKKLGKDISSEEREMLAKKSITTIAFNIGSGKLKIVEDKKDGHKFEINNEAFGKDEKSLEQRKKLVAALASFERPMVFEGISGKLGKKMKPPSTQAKIEATLAESINAAIIDKGYLPNDLSEQISPLLAKSLRISPLKLGYSISGKELGRIVGEINILPTKKESAVTDREPVTATTTTKRHVILVAEANQNKGELSQVVQQLQILQGYIAKAATKNESDPVTSESQAAFVGVIKEFQKVMIRYINKSKTHHPNFGNQQTNVIPNPTKGR